MIETERFLATNRAGWNHVAPKFHGGTALPEYGPLAATEDTLHLLELVPRRYPNLLEPYSESPRYQMSTGFGHRRICRG